jgi:xylulokinase
MSEKADNVLPGSDGLIFLPYLSGERTPHMDPEATGIYYGLTLKHSRDDMIRATMEGVVFSLRDSFDIFNELGLSMNRIVASGGGASSTCWKQIIADVFERDVYNTISLKEQACMGACILAGLGTGIFKSAQDVCENILKLEYQVTKPIAENVAVYKKNLAKFRSIYKLLNNK